MSAFRPTCPRCCYRCDPGSSRCCECGSMLGLDANQLRGLRDFNTIPPPSAVLSPVYDAANGRNDGMGDAADLDTRRRRAVRGMADLEGRRRLGGERT